MVRVSIRLRALFKLQDEEIILLILTHRSLKRPLCQFNHFSHFHVPAIAFFYISKRELAHFKMERDQSEYQVLAYIATATPAYHLVASSYFISQNFRDVLLWYSRVNYRKITIQDGEYLLYMLRIVNKISSFQSLVCGAK